MAVENDILAVLKSIDKLLKSASATTKERPSLTRKVAGGADDASKKDSAETSKVMKAVASASKKLSNTTQALTKTFDGLNVEVKRTISNFSSLGGQLSKLISSMEMKPIQTPTTNIDSKGLNEFQQGLGTTVDQIGKMNAALANSIDQIGKLSASLVISPDAFKNVDTLGKKLGELSAAATPDTDWAKELHDVLGSKVNPSLEKLASTAQTFDRELNKILKTYSKRDDSGEERLEKELKQSILTAKELNKQSSALAMSFKNANTHIAKLNEGLAKTTTKLSKFVDALSAKVQQPKDGNTGGEGLLGGFMSALSPIFGKPKEPAPVNVTVQPSAPNTAPAPKPAAGGAGGGVPIKPVLNTGPVNKGLGGLAGGLLKGGVVLGFFEKAVSMAWEASLKLANDFLHLASVGMGSTDALLSISKAALLSGMSVDEYTKVLAKNTELAARAGSLDRFNQLTSAADDQLARLGVFGKESKELQASLLNSATLAGVPQQQFGEVLKSQVDTFDKLRKSVNMTSSEFAELVSNLGHTTQFQNEMLGLAPQERAARQNELLQIAATGRNLGLSADASKKLTDALIAQRGATVKKRFEGAGRVRQLAAMTGDSASGEEAAQIIMKGRRATAEETDRLRQIMGNLDQNAQQLYESGNTGQQAALDTIDEALPDTVKNIMQANRPAQLADQSGDKFNKDFGQHVGEFGQWIGKLTATFTGIQNSVLAPLMGAVAGLAGGVLGKIVGNGILSTIKSGISGGGGIAKSLVGGAEAAMGAASNFMKTLARAPIDLIKNITSGIGSLFSRLMSFPGKALTWIGDSIGWVAKATEGAGSILSKGASLVRGAVSGLGEFFGTAGSWITKGVSVLKGAWSGFTGFFSSIGSTAGGIFKGFTSMFSAAFDMVGPLLRGAFKVFAWIEPLIAGIGEAFSGALSSTFSEGGGFMDRIFGIAVAAFRAIPAGILGALDSMLGTNLMNGLDIFFTTMVLGYKGVQKTFFDMLFAIVDSIPLLKDTGIGKMVKGWKEQQDKDVDKTAQTLDTLLNDSSQTLDKIGEKNVKTAEARTKDSDKATTKAAEADKKFSSTTMSAITRASVLSDASVLAGMPAQQNANTVAATPTTGQTVATPPSGDQQANLNKSDKPADANKQPAKENQGTDLTALLTEMIGVLRAQLAQQERQTKIGEDQLGLASLNTKPSTSFVSADYVNHHLLNV